jgi:hypothetical protein
MGYQRETAARGSMGQYVQLLFAGILEYAFFGTVPSTLSLIGAAIIMTSAIYVMVRFTVKPISCILNIPPKISKKSSPKEPEAIRLREPDSAIEEGLLCVDLPNRMTKFANTRSSSGIEDSEDLEEKPRLSSA